jgi:predicted nucleic acid-binding protein
MSDKVLIDTNVWIYLYASNPQAKYEKSQQLIHENFANIILSTQVLGEFYHVMTRKNLQSAEAAKEIVVETMATFPVLEIGAASVLEAMNIHQEYGYSYWDSLVIATALLNDCSSLYSEDMQHNQLIESKLRIINPFAMVSRI